MFANRKQVISFAKKIMPIIKNIHLLTDIPPGNIDVMETIALKYLRYSNIIIKILKNEPTKVTIRISQGKMRENNYLPEKKLSELIKTDFEKFFPEKHIITHAIQFHPSPTEIVDHSWIQKKMNKTKIRLKEIVSETGIDNTQLSALINGNKPLSQPMKALFWYYFLSKESKK